MIENITGPFCQSCSMPMLKPEDFGTDEKGLRINDYCHFCYKDGKFTNPDITLEQMIDLSVGCMVKYTNMTEDKARELSSNCIPALKRWTKN